MRLLCGTCHSSNELCTIDDKGNPICEKCDVK